MKKEELILEMQKGGQRWIGSQDEEKRRKKEREMKKWHQQKHTVKYNVYKRRSALAA